MPETPDLKAAYALQSPEDNRKLYADWAESYDTGFARDMDYQLPRVVALVLGEVAPAASPVLDVGAGTGLVAQNMMLRERLEVHGLDISADMLRVAAGKGLYDRTIEADLTQPLSLPNETYGAVVSAGTFTHGHVGPDVLDELLRIAQRGAWFVLAINATHFEARDFATKFDSLSDQILRLEHRAIHIYGSAADDAHRNDLAQVAVFQKR